MGKKKKVKSEMLLPDYYFSIKVMEEYGYKKGEMFPLHREKANVLFSLGLKIYILYSDNEEKEVDKAPDAYEQGTLFGIKKNDWLDFIKTDQGLAYIYAWNDVLNATQQVRIDKETSLDDYTSDFYENLHWMESFGIESFLDERYKQYGEISEEIYQKSRNKNLVTTICNEYAERMREAFSELVGGKLTATDFFADIFEEVTSRRFMEET